MSSEKKLNNDWISEKRKLYFDKEEKIFLEFNLEPNTTCQKIYEENRENIIEIIKSLNKNVSKNFDLDIELDEDNYYFVLIQPKDKNEKEKQKENRILPTVMDLKLKLKDNIYNIILNNPKSILCFLEKNKSKINLRKNARSLFVLEKDIYEDTQDSKLQDNTVKENFSQEILFKNTVFLYEMKNQNFIKKDIVIDFEKVAFNKENKYIYINKIKKFKYFIYGSEEFKEHQIKGDKMFGYIMIDINEDESYLFGHKKENIYRKLCNALKCSINNYRISLIDIQVDNDIYSNKSSLFAIYHLIIDNCFLIKEILSNNEKRKIFIDVFPEKKIGEIIDKILDYISLNIQ